MSERENVQDPLKAKSRVATKNTIRRVIVGMGIIVLAIAGIVLYYKHNLNYPSTDDAYINANLVNVSSRVEGFIKNINVKNDQFVHKGDLLLEIDPIDYDLAAHQSANNLSASKEKSDSAKQNIAVAKANVVKAQSDYDFNDRMAKRYTALFTQKAGTEQDMQKYINNANQALQQLSQAKLNLLQANANYKETLAELGAYKSALDSALTKTSYTQIRSPVDGFVTNLNLANGQLLLSGQNIFGLVDTTNWWLEANFKETQIARIKIGQKVTVKLDMYDHIYSGRVESISRASGNTFSILPAQNATGNWVKVTQRFTVRILLEDDPKYPLRVGASADVTIDTVN